MRVHFVHRLLRANEVCFCHTPSTHLNQHRVAHLELLSTLAKTAQVKHQPAKMLQRLKTISATARRAHSPSRLDASSQAALHLPDAHDLSPVFGNALTLLRPSRGPEHQISQRRLPQGAPLLETRRPENILALLRPFAPLSLLATVI